MPFKNSKIIFENIQKHFSESLKYFLKILQITFWKTFTFLKNSKLVFERSKLFFKKKILLFFREIAAKSAAALLTSPSQKPIAKAATFNPNAPSYSLSRLRSRTSRSRNSTSSKSRTAFAITRIAGQFSEPALISWLPTLATSTWTLTRTCRIHMTDRMQITRRCSVITTSSFRITKFSLWAENLNGKLFKNFL